MQQILDNPTLSRSLRKARDEIRQLPPERVAVAALDIASSNGFCGWQKKWHFDSADLTD